MESDEEEMASLRASNRYAGCRQKTSGISGPDACIAAAGGSDAAASPGLAESGSGNRSREEAPSDDSDVLPEPLAEQNDLDTVRCLFPVSFGKQKVNSNAGKDTYSLDIQADAGTSTGSRKDRAHKVHFGPRVPDAVVSLHRAGPTKEHRVRNLEGSTGVSDGAGTDCNSVKMDKVPSVRGIENIEDAEGHSTKGREDEQEENGALPLSHEVSILAHEKPVTALALDPSGSRMVTGSMDGTIKFFDFNGMSEAKNSFRCLEPVEGHMVQAVSFGTTGGILLVACSDSHARIYDRDGSSKPIQSTVKGDMYVRDMTHTKGHTQMLTDGTWHPFRSEHWMTSSLDGTMRLWDINATPVGMDQVLPSTHVLKTLDRRNVCVGGGAGRAGGLYPCCCTFSPADAKMMVGGCSDGSVQLFFQKTRYQKPDKILRHAHTAPVSDVKFIHEGGHSNLLISRSLDSTVKIWDCRMLSDGKGPVKSLENLAVGHEKAGVCTSPDGQYIVAATSCNTAVKGAASIRVFHAKDFTLKRTLSLGKRSGIRLAWPLELNQLLIGTSTGEVLMLYSPSMSKKGALHFVGKQAKAKPDGHLDDSSTGPIFNMTDQDDIKRFYSTGHGNMTKIRRQEARRAQKTLKPYMPPGADGAAGAQSDSAAFAAAVLQMGAQRLHLRSTSGADVDSQRALLAYDERAKASDLIGRAYKETQPQQLLDWSVEVSEGDKRMQETLKGDFCRKCGQKVCRCVDYSAWGQANKKPRTL